jgi:uncharacterized protein YggE
MEEKTFNLVNKIFILAAVLVVGILVFFVSQTIYQFKVLDNQTQNQITVSGQGKIYAKPDVAILVLGVENRGNKISTIVENNTGKMNKIISDVKTMGVEEKDIQTTSYNLSPLYNWTEHKGRVFEGYTLDQNIRLKIRDFTKIGDVFSKATGKGINVIGDLQFAIDNPEKVKQEARAKAIEQAKINARNLAKESGIKLGKIINVYENYSPYPVAYSSMKRLGGDMETSNVPTIEPGQQEINITINLTYRVK